jgi:hypothetical protein
MKLWRLLLTRLVGSCRHSGVAFRINWRSYRRFGGAFCRHIQDLVAKQKGDLLDCYNSKTEAIGCSTTRAVRRARGNNIQGSIYCHLTINASTERNTGERDRKKKVRNFV